MSAYDTPADIVAELRRQASKRNAVWPSVMLKDLIALCDSHDQMAAALANARSFIAAERKSFVECSTHPQTKEMDADDYDYVELMTALIAQIDAAIGNGEQR